ncbi:F-box domain-containing protein [Favolaschia claudopus]|uniref:F-box domain-containing protein n=1 Tax=Favolaschia claudopus TaxID=2862362 RepID=A0AAW0AYA0_9AGAR
MSTVAENCPCPILTLPNEITAEIFLGYLPSYPLCSPLFGRTSPTVLTQVCRQWRQIALALPRLWTAISFTVEDLPSHVTFEGMWLTRAGNCSLSIEANDYSEEGLPLTAEFFAKTFPYRERLERLYLAIHHPTNFELPTVVASMPLLRDLYLDLNLDFPHVVHFPDLPLLRTAILGGVAFSNVILPWSQLTTLSLRQVTLARCIPVLMVASDLVNCSLLELHAHDSDSIIQEVKLQYLETLTLSYDQDSLLFSEENHDCLANFTAPALRHLEVPVVFLGPQPLDALASFISRSECKLQHLGVFDGERFFRHALLASEASFPFKISFYDC